MSDALPDTSLVEWVGVIHAHSKHSDGLGRVSGIRTAARKLGLDFFVLTDHDTLAAKEAGAEASDEDLLFLVGTEVTCADNSHYLALDVSENIPARQPPAHVVQQVREAGGLGIIAHPFDLGSRLMNRGFPWKDWDVEGYEAMELWTFLANWGEHADTIPQAILGFFSMSRYVTGPNPEAYERWAALNRVRFERNEPPLPVIGGVDGHGHFGYRRELSTIRTHIWAPPRVGDLARDSQSLYTALRKGRSFLAYHGLGDAAGFTFQARGQDGDAYPASSADLKGPVTLSAFLPEAAEIRFMRGTRMLYASQGDRAEFVVETPGTYHCEVWIPLKYFARPWIFSNAVHVRM